LPLGSKKATQGKEVETGIGGGKKVPGVNCLRLKGNLYKNRLMLNLTQVG
jgi:hypothetical protein